MKQKLYNIIVCILSLVSVAFAIMDITSGLNQVQIWIDRIIYILFVVDYIVRITVSDDKKTFVKSNIFDLIAIIPFSSAFRIFRILKFTKVLKFAKLFRIGSLSARTVVKGKRFLNTNGFKYMLTLAVIAILLGAVGMMYFEHMTFQDSLWWSFVTATTVGYGDLSPATGEGRILASLLMLVGIGLIGSLTSTITSFFLYKEPVRDCNSEKVDMVVTLYEKLTDEEQQLFIDQVHQRQTRDSQNP